MYQFPVAKNPSGAWTLATLLEAAERNAPVTPVGVNTLPDSDEGGAMDASSARLSPKSGSTAPAAACDGLR